jgi:hypothetical protein
MKQTGAQRFKGWAATLCGITCALLVSALAATTVKAELPAESADNWKLQEETDNIRIYTTEPADSSFKAFKAVALIDAPIENLMAVMINPKSCMEWVLNCAEAYSFGKGTFNDRFAYSVNDLPWPVTDRDYVLHIRTQGDKASGEVTMNLNATPGKRAEISSRVRVNKSDTLYRFIPEGKKTRMIWVQHTNPNGSLPGWLVNSLLVDIPIQSLQALEKVAAKPRYQGFSMIYDDNNQLIDVRRTGSAQ